MRKYACSILLVLALAAVPAAAEELVYFVNGSVMPVVTHWVEGDMTYVDLGGNGVMAFPNELVEKIDTDVAVRVRTGPAAVRGRMAEGDRGTSVGRPQLNPRRAGVGQGIDGNAPAAADKKTALAQERAAKRRRPTTAPGRVAVPQGREIQGAKKQGDHYVIDSNQAPPKKGVRFQGKPDTRR